MSKSKAYNIRLPNSKISIQDFKIGDIIYLSGIIISGRDHFHKRVIEYKKEQKPLPLIFQRIKNSAIYHIVANL